MDGLRILPADEDALNSTPMPVFERIARALERIGDRLDMDAAVFNEMVEKGKGLSA